MRRLLFALLLALVIVAPAWAQSPPDIYYNDFEFPDMRVFNTSGIFKILPGEQPGTPANGGVCGGTVNTGVCTGFTLNSGFGGGAGPGLTIINDPANCHGGSWCARGDLPGGGTLLGREYSMRAGEVDPSVSGSAAGRTAQGCTDATPPGGFLTPPGTNVVAAERYPQVCFTTHLFFRFWMRWATNFSLTASPGSNGCNGKFLYIQSTGGTQFAIAPGNQHPQMGAYGVIGFHPSGDPTAPRVSWESEGPLMGGNPAVPNGFVINNFQDGLWHEFEVENIPAATNFTAGTTNVWKDGVLIVGNDNTNFLVANAGLDNNEWGMYINQNGPGLDNCVTADGLSTQFWIDDLAVSTQRIGGGTPPPLPPAAPSHLRFTYWLRRIWAWLLPIWAYA